MTEPEDHPEEWRVVAGYDGLYEVSDLGRVRSLLRSRNQPFVLATPLDSRGYPYVNLGSRAGGQRRWTVRVHQLVAAAFIGPQPIGQEVRHLDDVRTNNGVRNLAYGTSAQNKADMVRNGHHWQTRKTACPKGHRYTEENTHRGPRGRECRTCRRDRASARNRGRAA